TTMSKNNDIAVSPRSGVAPPKQTPSIRAKISLAKTKYTKAYWVKSGKEYIEQILNAPPESKADPPIAGYALHAQISKSLLIEEAQDYPEVSEIIEYINNYQEDMAVQGGLTNRTNPVFSIFLLKSKHGYLDSPQQLIQNNSFTIAPDLLADALK